LAIPRVVGWHFYIVLIVCINVLIKSIESFNPIYALENEKGGLMFSTF